MVSEGRCPVCGDIERSKITPVRRRGRGRAIVIFIKRTETITELAVCLARL